MKYFISSIANAKYKSQGDALCLSSWSCEMPVPALHSFSFGRGLGVCSQDTTAFDSPILLFFDVKEGGGGGGEKFKTRKKKPQSLSTLEDRKPRTKETI